MQGDELSVLQHCSLQASSPETAGTSLVASYLNQETVADVRRLSKLQGKLNLLNPEDDCLLG
jgi:hypothetical protein